MNAGARIATGKYLMFLHADTLLGEDFAAEFNTWVRSNPVWGFSPVRLCGSAFWCRVIETSINLRTGVTSGASGDQAQIVREDFFWELGGFKEIELMEDIDLSYRLRRLCPPQLLTSAVVTSSRRWRYQGVIRTVCLMWFLRACFRLGVSTKRLAQIYSRA